MDPLMKAKELGEAIVADERFVAYTAARAKYDADEELSAMLDSYDQTRASVIEANQAEERDEAKIEALNAAMNAMYAEIMDNATMVAMLEAKQKVDELLKQVNNIISFHVTGEVAGGGCSGNCASCSSCH